MSAAVLSSSPVIKRTISKTSKNRLSAVVLVSAVAVTAIVWNFPTLVDTVKGLAIAGGTVSGLYTMPIPTSAMQPCLKGSMNCIRTTWLPPPGTSQKKAIKAIKSCLSSYPEGGQNGVDLGGWEMEEDNLDENGTARLEFKSGGPITTYLNWGKPFIDDVLVAVQDDGRVEVRSSSRIGFGDMGVNQKRLRYLVSLLPKDWDAPDPDYS